jgi:hypothetical protein
MNDIALTKNELVKIYADLERHWRNYVCQEHADDEWYETKVGDRVFDINIYQGTKIDTDFCTYQATLVKVSQRCVSNTVRCASATLYECFEKQSKRGLFWSTDCNKSHDLFKGRYYKELTERKQAS